MSGDLHYFNGFKLSAILLCLSLPLFGVAQTILAQGGALSDYQGHHHIDSFPIQIKGLASTIDRNFGLAKICFNIAHPRVSDLKIELLSPDGTSIWLSNRNGRDDGWGYNNTCFRSNGFNGYIHQAQAPFEGEFIPDGRLSFINNGQNPNGTWYLMVQDLREGITGSLHIISLEFGANPMPNMEASPCAFDNPANCQCGQAKKKCVLLPDLIILGKFTQDQIKEYAWNDPHYPGQLRFAATIANIGMGPMETRGRKEWFCGNTAVDSSQSCPDGNAPRQRIYQRIYKLVNGSLQYDDVPAGTNYFDAKPGHDHFHVDNWVEFRLVKKEPNGKKTTLLNQSQKVSYCLFDSGICNTQDGLCQWQGKIYGEKSLPNYGLGNYVDCKSNMQGISVGGYDTYGLLYEGQFVELPKDLPSGQYWLEIEIDPQHRYKELSRKNNLFSMAVNITKQQIN